jgi:RNA polymerase sigma-70 factor, ECF subfamily
MALTGYCDVMGRSVGIHDVETSDGDLVRRVLAGDAEAYAGLVARHQARLMRYARHALGHREDAEEAVQDALVRGYRSLRRCDDPDGFAPWLFGILVNRCRTYGAQRARRARFLVHDESALERAAATGSGDEAAWRDAVEWALAQLESHYREAFLLKHVEELSYEEMTELTGVGVSALKMRVKRACEQLRLALQEVHRV